MTQRNGSANAPEQMKDNQCFIVFSSSSCRGLISRDKSSPRLLELLQDPNHAFSSDGCILVKNSWTTSSCILPLEGTGETSQIFIKRYNYQSSLYAFKNIFRRSRAKRTWRIAQHLLSRAIPTPLPVAYLERRRARVLRESFFITQKVTHAIPLSMLFLDGQAGGMGEHAASKKNLIDRTAALVQMMHERGIWHRDLKAANILVQRAPGKSLQLYLTDLDSIRIKDRVMPAERVRDLARLNVSLHDVSALSLRDRLRFLHSYLNIAGTRDKNLRAYWEAIRRETLKKLAKNI